MTDKTKAATPGRQCQHSRDSKNSIIDAGGQWINALILKLNFRFCLVQMAGQPFGSMPRCCNSFLTMRLIHAANDSSPSCCCAASIISLNSGSSLNWNGGLPRLSFLCVDTSITPHVLCLCVMTHYAQIIQKATSRTVGADPGRLTTIASSDNEAAMKNHTTHPQGQSKHTWRFPALSVTGMCKNHLPSFTDGRYSPAAGVSPPAGFSSLINTAGSRFISDMRYFCARNSSCIRIMAGRDGEAFAPAGFCVASLLTLLRPVTPFSSAVARLRKSNTGAATMAVSAHLNHVIISATEVRHV